MSQVSVTLSAVGSSSPLLVRSGEYFTYSADASAGFDGRLILEKSSNGGQAWEQILSSLVDVTQDSRVVIDNGGQNTRVRWRVELVNLTLTGTVDVVLADVAEVAAGWEDQEGIERLQIVEGGVKVPGNLAVTGTAAITGNFSAGGLSIPAGSSSLASLTVVGATALNGGIAVDTDKFTVADGNGNTETKGTLKAAGLATLNGGIVCDTDKFSVADTTGDTVVGGTLQVAGATISAAGAAATVSSLVSGSAVLSAAGFAGSTALQIGAAAAGGLQFKVIDEVVDLTGNAATYKAMTTPVPAGAVILSVQANIDELVVGGGTTVKVGLGLNAGDVDAYGLSGDFVLNTKVNTIPAHAVLAVETAIDVCGVVANGSALGDTNLTAGKVHVRIIYLQLASLANAA